MNTQFTAAANDNAATLILDAYAYVNDQRHAILPPLVDAALAEFGIGRRIMVGPANWIASLGRLPDGWTGVAANCNQRAFALNALSLTSDVRASTRVFIASTTKMVAELAPVYARFARVSAIVDRYQPVLRTMLRGGVLRSTLIGALENTILPLPPAICAANDII